MPDMDVFEYAVIRFVPRVERGEYINIGVVLYCRGQRFLDVRMLPDLGRCALLFPDADAEELQRHALAFQQIARGLPEGGPIAQLIPAERFRWLTAKRSTIIQPSPVHPGITANAAQALDNLYEKLVK